MFSRAEASARACSSVRQNSVVRIPPRSKSTATAVPKDPAPTTEARRIGCALATGNWELSLLVIRPVPALGRSEPAALGRDRPALHAVGRRDLEVHELGFVQAAVLRHPLLHLVR